VRVLGSFVHFGLDEKDEGNALVSGTHPAATASDLSRGRGERLLQRGIVGQAAAGAGKYVAADWLEGVDVIKVHVVADS
jgi:hypothetical protein